MPETDVEKRVREAKEAAAKKRAVKTRKKKIDPDGDGKK